MSFSLIFNNSDSETEFEGFEVRDINAGEARYLQHIENMENIDSDIEFSDWSSDENYDFDSEDDIALAEISKWSVHLRPVQTMDFNEPHPGPSTPMEKKKEEVDFFHLLFPERLYSDIATHTNAYAMACIVDKPKNKIFNYNSYLECWI